MLRATYRHSDRVELSIGPAHAYTLILSYRYYFWRKFNVELELWLA